MASNTFARWGASVVDFKMGTGIKVEPFIGISQAWSPLNSFVNGKQHSALRLNN